MPPAARRATECRARCGSVADLQTGPGRLLSNQDSRGRLATRAARRRADIAHSKGSGIACDSRHRTCIALCCKRPAFASTSAAGHSQPPEEELFPQSLPAVACSVPPCAAANEQYPSRLQLNCTKSAPRARPLAPPVPPRPGPARTALQHRRRGQIAEQSARSVSPPGHQPVLRPQRQSGTVTVGFCEDVCSNDGAV